MRSCTPRRVPRCGDGGNESGLCGGLVAQAQMMHLLSEQHELRAQNYELMVERQHLHAELHHMSDQMAEATYWREQLYQAQMEAGA